VRGGRRSAPSSKALDHRTDLYARAVLGDRAAVRALRAYPYGDQPCVAGPHVRQACERHLQDRRLANSASGHPRGWRFDAAAADYVIAFFETVLRLPDTKDANGDPKPFELAPPLAFIVGSIFGWRGADGYRRFREAYLEIGKGNAKTPLFAGIGLYGLTEDQELAAEIYAAATDRQQARILFTDAERMVACSPDLDARLTRTVNNIADPESMSFFRPYSRDQGMKSGPRPHMALIDELHEHPTGDISMKIRAGAKGRKQPFFGEITNSGFDRTSICWAHREHSVRVLEGTVEDDRWFAYVCALDEGDDPLTDPTCWIKTNPMLGISLTREYLQRQVDIARNLPSETNTVLRLNFCVWTQAQSRYLDMPRWHACRTPIDDDELIGLPCYAGLDLGQSDDFSAFVLLWQLTDGRVVVRPRFWIPAIAIERHPERPYAEWQREGLLEVTDGDVTDYDVIETAVAAACRLHGVTECAYDKRFAEQMSQHLQGQGITMTDMPQGFQLSEALIKLRDLVTTGQIVHDGHAILGWMAANAVVRHRDGALRLDKEKARDKIDGIAALVMALARLIVRPVTDETEAARDFAARGLFL